MAFILVEVQKNLCSLVPNLQLLVVVLGEGFWVITYMLIILRASRCRTYGIPITATALNYTWEVLYSFIFPTSCWVVRLLRYVWLALDSVIVWQILRYGKSKQVIPPFRQHFYVGVVLIFLMAGTGNWTFRRAFQDQSGELAAYGINFIMSVLFVFLFYSRKDGNGLSYAAAWTKMLGTGILSLASAISFISNPSPSRDFMLFLFVSIFLFDVSYIILLHRLPKPVPGYSAK